jgi:hypothetical protein
VREEAQDHLQATAAGAQHRALGFGAGDVGGQLCGNPVAGGLGGVQGLLCPADFLLGGGDQLRVLGGGGDGGIAQQAGQGPRGLS